MAEIYELPIRRDLNDCMADLQNVIRQHQDAVRVQDDAINLLGHLSMIFGGQDPAQAAEILHETFLSLTAFHDLPVVIERDRHGNGTMRIPAGGHRKPE